MKIVLDTNVFIDALFNACEDCKLIFRKEHDGEFSLVMSNKMNEELINIIHRIMDDLNTEGKDRKRMYTLLMRILRRTTPIEPMSNFTKCEDYSDNMFFSCAIDGNADYLVSKDKHIHKVKEKYTVKNKLGNNIKIMYPDEFIAETDKIKLALHYKNLRTS